jgi:hypothetical protein
MSFIAKKDLGLKSYTEDYVNCHNTWQSYIDIILSNKDISDRLLRIIKEVIIFPNVMIPSYRLTIKGNCKLNNVILMPGEKLTVGRSQTADICINDTAVSNIHCVVFVDGSGRLVVKDAGSLNGTFIDSCQLALHENRRLFGECKLYIGSASIDVTKTFNQHRSENSVDMKLKTKVVKNISENQLSLMFLLKFDEQNLDIVLKIEKNAMQQIVLAHFALQVLGYEKAQLNDALFETLIGSFIKSLKKYFRSRYSVTLDVESINTCSGDNYTEELSYYCLEIQTGSGQVKIQFGIDPKQIVQYLKNPQFDFNIQRGCVPEEIRNAAILFRCVTKAVTMPLSDFEYLKPGDVILPGLLAEGFNYGDQTVDRVVLMLDSSNGSSLQIACDCRICDEYLELVINAFNGGENKMNRQDNALKQSNSETAMCETRCHALVDEPLISARIELDSLCLTVEELSELRAGQILKLKRRVDDPVCIRVDNRTVARGILVRIDDEFGVELLGKETVHVF